jgi:hypothetical protein
MTKNEGATPEVKEVINEVITSKLKLPAKKEVVGVLLSAEVVELTTGDIILVSVQDIDDEIITVSTSPNYWKKVGKSFIPDSIVKISYEVRIKGVTGYAKDSTKPNELTEHGGSGNNLIGINRYSSMNFQRLVDSKDKESNFDLLNAVEPERVQAYATLLAAYVRR